VSKVGKITIEVTQAATTEVITVRTTGSKGTVSLNTISTNQGYASHSPSPDAHTFWTAVLTRALTQV
jgi:hypothetical protein